MVCICATSAGAAHSVPGVIQAEDYDDGGAGVSYYDTTPGNQPGFYRSDDVDIETNAPNAYHIAFIEPGEWLQYTVVATQSFRARIRSRVASLNPPAAYAWRFSLDGRTVDVRNGGSTGGWFSFTSVTSPLPFLITSGTHTLRVDFIRGPFNFDEFEIMTESAAPPPYLDPDEPLTNRIADLLSRMTLEEKKAQLALVGVEFFGQFGDNQESDIATWKLGALLNGGGAQIPGNRASDWADLTDRFQGYALTTRLHIPVIYGVDAVHGHGNVLGATVFPHQIGLGATRNAALVERVAQAAAVEIRATGMHWTYAPAVSVPRDERWGRFYEGYGETPDLVGEMSAAAVRGYQGGDVSASTSVLACIKHFAADGGTIWGTGVNGKIDQGDAVLDSNTFFSIHVAPYSNALAAGAGSVMASYSSWNGRKMHGHTNLLTGLLKSAWGFQGLVVSDWRGVDQLYPNYAQSIVAAINAGIDLVMIPDRYKEFIAHLDYAVDHSNISTQRLNDAVRRVLRAKFQLGLFERPFADRALLSRVGSAEHRAIARQAVRESLVVLQNQNDLLPLPKDLGRIHVSGRTATNLGFQCGGWTIYWQGGSGPITEGTTIFQAITQTVSSATTVSYSLNGSGAAGADAAIVVIGEEPYAESFGDSATIHLATQDVAVIQAVRAAGVPTVVVLVSGRPLDISSAITNVEAMVAAWLPGTEGQGVADVLFGDHFPRARLPQTWPRNIAQVPINVGDAGYDPLYPLDHAVPIEPQVRFLDDGAGRYLAWRDGAAGFTLESSTNLAAAGWSPWGAEPYRTNGFHRVPRTDDELRLFRLRRP